jgi:hypothetical protein
MLDEWWARFPDWWRAGTIHLPHVVINGLEGPIAALRDTTEGRYLGMIAVELDARFDPCVHERGKTRSFNAIEHGGRLG